jgi:small-conductance mechanosensitive channel
MTTKQDMKTALNSMLDVTKHFLTNAIKFLLILIGVLAIGYLVGYCVVNYFLQSVVVVALAMLCGWFWIELETARIIREKEEQQEAYWAEKSKPMHDSL